MFQYQAESLSKSLHGATWVNNNYAENDYYVGFSKRGRHFQIQTASFKERTHKLVEVGIGGTCEFKTLIRGDLLDVIDASRNV